MTRIKRGWLLLGVIVTLIVSLAIIYNLPYQTIISFASEFLPIDFLVVIPDFLWQVMFCFIVVYSLIYFVLAPNNLCFTFVQEGRAKAIMRAGKFAKFLIEWENYRLDSKGEGLNRWNVVQIPQDEQRSRLRKIFRTLRFWRIFGGLRFYGIWPLWDVHIYKFRWTGLTEDGKTQTKEEWLDYVLLKYDVYFNKVVEAEDMNQLPLDIELLLTIRVVNPYKARFIAQGWLELVINRIQPLIVEYVAGSSFRELSRTTGTMGGQMWTKFKDEEEALVGLMEEPEISRGEFINKFGVEIRKIEVKQINPLQRFRDLTLRKLEAQREAEALEETAKGEKKAIILRSEGEAEGLKKVYTEISKFGLSGFLLKTAQEAKGKDLPLAVLTHYLAQRSPKDFASINEQHLEGIVKAISEGIDGLSEVVDKMVREST